MVTIWRPDIVETSGYVIFEISGLYINKNKLVGGLEWSWLSLGVCAEGGGVEIDPMCFNFVIVV